MAEITNRKFKKQIASTFRPMVVYEEITYNDKNQKNEVLRRIILDKDDKLIFEVSNLKDAMGNPKWANVNEIGITNMLKAYVTNLLIGDPTETNKPNIKNNE